MQDKHLFEYAIIRVVPKVEREEFLNVGVIVYCRSLQFLKTIFNGDPSRLKLVFPELDFAEICTHLMAFEQICEGKAAGGPIAGLDIASRFRWLTAKRSTVLQTSAVHPGFCTDPEQTTYELYEKLVLVQVGQ